MQTIIDMETAASGNLPPIPDGALNKGIASTWKDQTKIEDQRARNRHDWTIKAAADFRTAQVTAVGFTDLSDDTLRRIYFQGPTHGGAVGAAFSEPEQRDGVVLTWVDDEAELLRIVWRGLRGFAEQSLADATPDSLGKGGQSDLVGFGHRGWDIDLLLYRSAIHDLEPSRFFDRRRYSHRHGFVDWMEILAGHNIAKISGWGLSDYMRAPELQCPVVGYGEGRKCPERWAAGDYQYVIDHLDSDLLGIRWLHRKFCRQYLLQDPHPTGHTGPKAVD